jgi:hypothetical protein
MLTVPVSIADFRSDAVGVATLHFPLSPQTSVRFFVQAASFTLDPVRVQASNGLEVCRA